MPLERRGHGTRDEISRARRATAGAVRPDRARRAGRRSEVTPRVYHLFASVLFAGQFAVATDRSFFQGLSPGTAHKEFILSMLPVPAFGELLA